MNQKAHSAGHAYYACRVKQSNRRRAEHGLSTHPIYNTWKCMKDRCYKEDNPAYKWYGAKGIQVCLEWKESIEDFLGWALSSGWKKGLTLDRKDPNGNYCPENCQWMTRSENAKKGWRDKHLGQKRDNASL